MDKCPPKDLIGAMLAAKTQDMGLQQAVLELDDGQAKHWGMAGERITRSLNDEAVSRNPFHPQNIWDKAVNGTMSGLYYFKHPSAKFGDAFIQPFTKHAREVLSLPEGEQMAAFKAGLPELLEHYYTHEPTFNGSLKGEAKKYIIDYQRGLRVFGADISRVDNTPEAWKLLKQGVGNLTGNAVRNNPVIAGMNIVETGRLFSLYGTQSLGGLKDVLEMTGGNPFKRIPEFVEEGLYDLHPTSLVDFTQSAVENIAYATGKRVYGNRPELAIEAVKKGAFKLIPGDQPDYAIHASPGMWTMARFTIEETKHLAQGIIDLKAGKPGVVLSYFIAKPLFMGAESTIPAPVWSAMDKEQKEQVEEINDVYGLGIIPKVTRVDMTNYSQLGAVPVGLGLQILGDTFERGAKEGVKVFTDEDPKAKLGHAIKAAASMTGLVAPNLLIGDINAQRAYRIAGDALIGKYATPEEAGKEYVKRSLHIDIDKIQEENELERLKAENEELKEKDKPDADQ